MVYIHDFYPPIDPYAHGYLKADSIHAVYWEECGNPDGVPVVFLHGGPGSGCSPLHRRFFDPSVYRIILFDQRGCGRSKPFGEVRANTTEHLIADMEKLRKARDIKRWHVFGGSWGSTLALSYAQEHPDRCISLTLRGVFLFRTSDIYWFLYGMRLVFPEAWRSFSSFVPPAERTDLLSSYYTILTGKDRRKKEMAQRVWLQYESSCSTLMPSAEPPISLEDAAKSALPILEAHYFLFNRPLPENKLLDAIDKINHIPCTIVQGRYDMICPVAAAEELHRRWPEAELNIIPDAGHSAMEPGIKTALIAAMEKVKNLR